MIRLRVLATGLSAALCLLPGAGRAGEITVQIDPGPGANFAAQAGVSIPALESALRTELEELYRASDARRYIQAFGDAQAFSNRGLGADYASNPKTFIIGFATNVSVNADREYVASGENRKPPIDGVGANFSFLAGTNLAWAGLRPVTIYGNYFRASGGYKQFDGTSQNFGLHAQVKLFENVHDPKRSVWFAWGGVDITTGIEHGALDLNLTDTVTNRILLTSNRNGPYVDATSSGTFKADMSVWSVPIEVTTNVRFLYLLSLYGGLGFDWQFGTNRLSMDLNSDLLGTVPGQASNVDVGQARITASESTSPTASKLRTMLGLQVNVAFIRVFAHVNVMPDRGLLGVVTGLRLAF